MTFRFVTAVLALVVSSACWAHHSFARFDADQKVTLVGVVKEFQWTNPHCWIELEVPNKSGKPTQWSIEFGSPNLLQRQGWKKDAIKPGDQVTIVVNPAKSGATEAYLLQITTPQGVTFPKSAAANK